MERTVALKTVKRDKTYVDTDILFFFFSQIRYPVAHALTGLGGRILDG